MKPISPFFLVQSGLKYPKLCNLGLTMKTNCCWGKLGAIWGPLGGHMGAIWGWFGGHLRPLGGPRAAH